MFAVRQIYSRIALAILFCLLLPFFIFQMGMKYGSREIITYDTSLQNIKFNPEDLRDNHINHPKAPIAKPLIIEPTDNSVQYATNAQTSLNRRTKTIYPKRMNMGPCPKLFGKVMVFVAVVESSYKTHYKVAQDSLKCYLESVDYIFKLVDLDHDERVNRLCKHGQLFFKKHCAASVYLKDADWMLVLDADAGVVNPNHCIEEYIDDRVDLVFYERAFNWEIAKNTDFARDFLMKWANWEFTQPKNWNGADNGVLQIHILQSVLPDAKAEIKACDKIWRRGKGYETYMAYVTCVKVMLGAVRLFPGQLRILRRVHGWVRDGYMTADSWSEHDFMLHGWKLQEINKEGWNSPFSKMFNLTECTGDGYEGWNWRSEKRLSVDEIKKQLSNFEHGVSNSFPKEGRVHPYLTEPDIGECYPDCDAET